MKTLVKPKKYQIWRRKSDGIEIVLTRNQSDQWLCIRRGNRKILHHITTFDLNKYWELI